MVDLPVRKVALTGATGFIGSYLLDCLQGAGWSVRAISRSGADGMHACGDLSVRSPDWSELLAGVDTVIHAAAVAHQPLNGGGEDSSLRQRLFKVNRDAVEELAKGCLAAGVRRIIFLSTVKVYGESTEPGMPFDELADLHPEDDYGESKRQAEAILRSFAAKGIEVCCLRLPLVYGPKPKANFLRLQNLAVSGYPLPLGSINNRRSLLGLNNLSSVIQYLLTLDSWPWQELNVADSGPVSTPELIRALAAASGHKPLLLPFPVWLIRWVARVLGRARDVDRVAGNLEVSVDRLLAIPEVRLLPTHTSIQQLLTESGGTDVSGGAAG